jgi:hypothetical protein
MYPEVAVLSGMFMISPTTVQREIRVLLPLLWHYLKGQVQWPTHQQWHHMAHHWELFPGAVAVIDGTRHEIQRPQIIHSFCFAWQISLCRKRVVEPAAL